MPITMSAAMIMVAKTGWATLMRVRNMRLVLHECDSVTGLQRGQGGGHDPLSLFYA